MTLRRRSARTSSRSLEEPDGPDEEVVEVERVRRPRAPSRRARGARRGASRRSRRSASGTSSGAEPAFLAWEIRARDRASGVSALSVIPAAFIACLTTASWSSASKTTNPAGAPPRRRSGGGAARRRSGRSRRTSAARRAPRRSRDPLLHLAGGLVREGEGDDRLAAGDAVRDEPGAAGASGRASSPSRRRRGRGGAPRRARRPRPARGSGLRGGLARSIRGGDRSTASALAGGLLDRDRLRQVPRLVDVAPAPPGDVVSEELERDDRDDRLQVRVDVRGPRATSSANAATSSSPRETKATRRPVARLHLAEVRGDLLVERVAGARGRPPAGPRRSARSARASSPPAGYPSAWM